MTHLRRIMLGELQRRNYADSTARYYVRAVEQFARHFGKSPDKLGLEHLRTYQAYLLKQRKLAVGTVVSQVAALRFFFVRTLKRHEFHEFLPYPRERQRLPRILSKEKVARLINSSGKLAPPQFLFRSFVVLNVRKEVIPTDDAAFTVPQRWSAHVEPAVNTVGTQDTILNLVCIPGFY